jgi:hypothetical protein
LTISGERGERILPINIYFTSWQISQLGTEWIWPKLLTLPWHGNSK